MHTLRMTTAQHGRLRTHLYPGDGLEAVAVAASGRAGFEGRHAQLVHAITEIPHADCIRSANTVTWRTRALKDLLAKAAAEDMAILKIHSHPGGFSDFSCVDDLADAELFEAIAQRVPGEHMSAVMLPDGRIFARRMGADGVLGPVDRVAIVGDDLTFWDHGAWSQGPQAFDERHRQMFGDRTTDLLKTLSVGIVGISGTGSPDAEMVMRLGFGRMVLVEPQGVEDRNLNRIYGATQQDADEERNKALMTKERFDAAGLGGVVEIVMDRVESAEAIARLSTCDILFGCVDSVEGRDVLNRIATFYSLPYIDIGVRLDADGEGGVSSVSAGIHYLQPGGSSLKTRGVYSEEDLYAEYLRRTDPAFYEDQVRRGYIRGVRVDRPAVISFNTAAAAAAVNELLARLHPYRTAPNADFAIQKLLFSHGRIVTRPDGEPDWELAQFVGRGDCDPPLMSPRLGVAAA